MLTAGLPIATGSAFSFSLLIHYENLLKSSLGNKFWRIFFSLVYESQTSSFRLGIIWVFMTGREGYKLESMLTEYGTKGPYSKQLQC